MAVAFRRDPAWNLTRALTYPWRCHPREPRRKKPCFSVSSLRVRCNDARMTRRPKYLSRHQIPQISSDAEIVKTASSCPAPALRRAPAPVLRGHGLSRAWRDFFSRTRHPRTTGNKRFVDVALGTRHVWRTKGSTNER